MTTQLPDRDKLAIILTYIDASNQEDWVNVTLALGRSYNQDPDVYQLVKNWGESYSERKPVDSQREYHNFFVASKAPGGVTVATVIDMARKRGWVPALDRAQVISQTGRNDFIPPVITIDANIASCTAAPEKNVTENDVIRQFRASLHAVLSFFVFDSTAMEDSSRIAFLTSNKACFSCLPAAERASFEALHRYCTCVSPEVYTTSAFLNWATAQGGNVPDSIDSWERICDPYDHHAVADSMEAGRVFETAVTKARLFNASCMAKDACKQALQLAHDVTDPEESLAKLRGIIARMQAQVTEADGDLEYVTGVEIAEAARENVSNMLIPERRHREFLPTGHQALDAHIYGYARKEVTLMAAHSGVGKTWYAIDAARLAAAAGYRVLFFSTEMTTGAVSSRFGMNINQTSLNQLSASYLHFGTENNPDCQAFFDNTAAFLSRHSNVTLVSPKRGGLSIEQISADMARFAIDGPVDLVIVDYLQNVQNDNPRLVNAPVYQRVLNVMDQLASLAIEHNTCILATAQLNNPNRKQGSDPTPNLYDIADASAVVRSAAAVIDLYQIAIGEDEAGRAIIETRAKITKSRHGSCTSYPLQVKRLVGSRFEFIM